MNNLMMLWKETLSNVVISDFADFNVFCINE